MFYGLFESSGIWLHWRDEFLEQIRNRRWATSCEAVLTARNVLVNLMATSRNQKFFIMVVVRWKAILLVAGGKI